MRAPRRLRPSRAGFTIVEMLVSLALLALISLLLIQAIGAAGMLSRQGGRLSADTDLDIVRDHLRGSLARLVGRDTNGRRPAFLGEPERFSGTVLANRGTERGGAVRQSVWAVRRDDGTVDLVETRGVGPESGARPPEVLVGRAAAVRLRYFGAGLIADPQPGWFPAWTRRDRPPTLIEISLAFPPGDRRRWPPLLVPLGVGQ
ncbi:prepilin-type N-terminal cleavage/methylation domain-containing protein [Methylobacterium sp. Leaf118]|uniref:prepilin-type N-terminal cleavage/methylation domain-containing protein n=1 Tax=Methylobacterium sp. Leaf118 TaxID=2876562 RepID=UPI001E6026BB|nr:prepilin-type N-terminal cleavage/methylation domain-containing protein [Methylobacterium sp. Leaf118]